MRALVVCVGLAALVLVGCGGSDKGGAGNGGGGGNGGSGGTGGVSGCTPFTVNGNTLTADTCTGDNVCLNNACVPAFPRHYEMAVGGAVAQHKMDGSDWDLLGGLPDPYYVIKIDGTVVLQSDPAQDTLTPPGAKATIDLPSADPQITLQMFDSDVIPPDDTIVACDPFTLTPALIRSAVSCAWKDGTTGMLVGFRAQ